MNYVKDYLCCIIFILVYQTDLMNSKFQYHDTQWIPCSTPVTSFLVQWNIPLRNCVSGCIIRKRCNAVLYNRHQKKCDLMETDHVPGTSSMYREACAYIKRTDMIITDAIENACQSCTMDEVCQVDEGECRLNECRTLEVANANVVGNTLRIGAKVQIVPDDGYILSSSVPSSKCTRNGTWIDVPTTIIKDCGSPPTELNAELYDGSTVYGSIRTYTCKYGYGVVNQIVDMTVTCTKYSTWSPAQFHCLEKTCQVGWTRINQSCYKFNQTKIFTHAVAENYCTSFDAHLVTMETYTENDNVKQYLVRTYGSNIQSWWLGIDDKTDEGYWVFTHTGMSITVTDWGPGEPSNNNFNEHCAVLGYSNTKWADVICGTLRRVICEKT